MNIDHVKALAAAVDEGTVEGAAFVLGITASAASQRIRTLESRLGQVLIRRTNPITVTEAGQAILRYARQVELLEAEALDRLHGIDADASGAGSAAVRREPTVLRVGVNADSMATWFRPIFAEAAGWDDVVLRIEMVDQDKALPLLASGEVLGTITSTATGGYGTTVVELGAMRYVAVAERSLFERHSTGTEADLLRLPMVNFGQDDDLQFEFLRRCGVEGRPPMSVVPGSAEFAAAVEAGLGWGMVPVMQLDGLDADLVEIGENPHIDVPLYWHHWTLASDKLSRLTRALQTAAAAMR
ncbi:ArgP/LysG family DNA-binding transcriptional regulator [Brevibacterium spongiae]|uniref:ArgP/LysG family DNA-binding transcriptional regulator n=1 Tax=Brevibacterium spongiae TaxID=2909672 RepID=A0ABY5SN19_9MICO|nr:ArgP/LysG family DNA-binding transcriptional regulator [Brevibacterium spongiae]UVI35695.1 ArgP/LysG family DNA-binding transcriptional regulator [Brevibacterium spongiae]